MNLLITIEDDVRMDLALTLDSFEHSIPNQDPAPKLLEEFPRQSSSGWDWR